VLPRLSQQLFQTLPFLFLHTLLEDAEGSDLEGLNIQDLMVVHDGDVSAAAAHIHNQHHSPGKFWITHHRAEDIFGFLRAGYDLDVHASGFLDGGEKVSGVVRFTGCTGGHDTHRSRLELPGLRDKLRDSVCSTSDGVRLQPTGAKRAPAQMRLQAHLEYREDVPGTNISDEHLDCIRAHIDHRPPFAGAAVAGANEISVDVSALAPGVYTYRLEAGGEAAARRMVVIR